MKKTLIALALATLPVASMADVVLYGQIKGGVEVTKVKNVSGTTTAIVDYGSRIGFKGQENLKGDINAIWQLESKVNIGGGSAGFGTRDSFIGLQSDSLGTVKAGYQQTPVAEMNGDLDQWEYSGEYAGLGLFTRSNDAASRRLALSYETPVFSGFSAKAFVAPSDNTKNLAADKSADSAVYGLGLKYVQNPEADKMGWFGGLAGTYVRNGANNLYYTANKPTDAKKYGYQALAQVGYEGQQWFAGLAYQHAENVDGIWEEVSAKKSEHITKVNEVAASVAYSPDEVLTLKASAAMGFGIKHLDNNGKKSEKWSNGKYYQAVVGADYNLSKRTTLNSQLGYYKLGSSDLNLRGGVLSVGMKHRF